MYTKNRYGGQLAVINSVMNIFISFVGNCVIDELARSGMRFAIVAMLQGRGIPILSQLIWIFTYSQPFGQNYGKSSHTIHVVCI